MKGCCEKVMWQSDVKAGCEMDMWQLDVKSDYSGMVFPVKLHTFSCCYPQDRGGVSGIVVS